MGLDSYLHKAPRWGTLSQITDLREKLYELQYSGYTENLKLLGNEPENSDPAVLMAIDQKQSILNASWIPAEFHPLITSPDTFFVEVAYWRKFNALHSWFVDTCQDGVDECQYSEVPEDKLTILLDILHYVKQTKNPDALKPKSGFFFGSTEIDDWYWSNVDDAISQLEKIKSEIDFSKEILVYHSSW
jgi:hypothetical protein